MSLTYGAPMTVVHHEGLVLVAERPHRYYEEHLARSRAREGDGDA
jgi:hypothetical protein